MIMITTVGNLHRSWYWTPEIHSRDPGVVQLEDVYLCGACTCCQFIGMILSLWVCANERVLSDCRYVFKCMCVCCQFVDMFF